MENRFPLSSLGRQIKAHWRKYRPNCRPRWSGRGICSGPNRMVRAALSITDFGGVCRGDRLPRPRGSDPNRAACPPPPKITTGGLYETGVDYWPRHVGRQIRKERREWGRRSA